MHSITKQRSAIAPSNRAYAAKGSGAANGAPSKPVVSVSVENFVADKVGLQTVNHFNKHSKAKRISIHQNVQVKRQQRKHQLSTPVQQAEEEGQHDEPQLIKAVKGKDQQHFDDAMRQQADEEVELARLALEQSGKPATPEQLESLREEHLASLRANRQTAQDLAQPVVEKHPKFNQLRGIFAPNNQGQVVLPTPHQLARALLQKLGSDQLPDSMAALRQVMAVQMRSQQKEEGMGARAATTQRIATLYHSVQSTSAIASTLHTELATAKLPLQGSSPDILLHLLKVPDAGPNGSALVASMVDLEKLPPRPAAQAHRSVLDATRNLPTTLWPPDKLNHRMELLWDLHQNATTLDAKDQLLAKSQASTPLHQLPKEVQKEVQLRQTIALKRKETP